MIEAVISSITVIIAVLLADYLSSLAFGSSKKISESVAGIILFLILFNLFLFNIIAADNLLIQLLIYFLVSFVSIISSRSIVFLLFNKSPVKLFYKRNLFNSSAIRLANLLNKKYSKSEVIDLFRKAGFSSSFAEHLNKTLKE